MPTPLQKRVLLALESGQKLHELLREVNMPSKAMVEEWRDSSPEFDADYARAADAGKAKRERLTGKPEAIDRPTPKLVRVVVAELPRVKRPTPSNAPRHSGPTTVHGSPDDARRMELSQKLTGILGDGATYITPPGRSKAAAEPLPTYSPSAMPAAIKTSPADLQQHVLDKLRSGTRPAALVTGIPGFNQAKLAAWRKAPAFAAQWDAAKAAGRGLSDNPKPARAAPAVVAPTPTVTPSPVVVAAQPAAPADAPEVFYAVWGTHGSQVTAPRRWASAELAQAEAERVVKETNKPAYVLRAVLEIAPIITVATTARPMAA